MSERLFDPPGLFCLSVYDQPDFSKSKPEPFSRLVVATGNAGKLREIRRILGTRPVEILSQRELGVPQIEETGLSFVENALLKARNAAEHTRLPAIADDSGLEVDALDGQPGIYSSRFAGHDASDSDNVDLLLERLRPYRNTTCTARFQCVAVLMKHARDPTPLVCHGTWEGEIVRSPRGEDGFGYDPVFRPVGLERTAAELPSAEKDRLSHRAQAFNALVEKLEKESGLFLPSA